MSSIVKWKIYCNTEAEYITGYLDDIEGTPTVCFHNNEHTIDTTKSVVQEKIYTNHIQALKKWKIYCDTEETYVYGYTDHADTPTDCFNNNTHIVSRHPELLCKIENNIQKIQEELVKTGGNLQLESHTFDIPASGTTGEITEYGLSFPHPVNLLSFTICPTIDNIGDSVTADVGHHTTIGALTEDVSIGISGGITGFGVSQTVIDNLYIGYLVTLTTGVTSCEMGRCIMIDPKNNKISTEFSSTVDFLASSPTYVQQTVQMVRQLYFPGSTVPLHLGDDKIGASYIPANTVGRVLYKNNSGTAKQTTFYIEYLY